MTTPDSSTARRRTRIVQLLTQLLASNWFTVDELADVLVVTPRTIGQYVAGEIEIPVERQVCFARFLIERVPSLSRQGHNLLSQVTASIEFSRSTTRLHMYAPISRSRTF